MDLKNKVVVITGGSKGLGKVLALCFLKNGSKVVVCSREGEFKNLKNGIIGVKADVTKENEIEALAKKVINDFGKIDIWVNNAGIWLPHKPIEETDWKRAHDLMEVNLFGTVYGSKIALAQMRKQNFGLIVNIISTSGLNGKINETAKKPSFSNVFPELNHNEIAGFHANNISKLLSQNFNFIWNVIPVVCCE